MKDIKKALLIIAILFLPIFLWGNYKGYQNKKMMDYVYSSVIAEASKIDFGEEITTNKYEDSSCHYDFKVRANRCYSFYSKYYGTNNETIDELVILDRKLTDLGWDDKGDLDLETMKEQLNRGYLPMNLYFKNGNNLQLSVGFFTREKLLEAVENSLGVYKDGLRKDVDEALLSAFDNFKYIYSIEIKTDVIR